MNLGCQPLKISNAFYLAKNAPLKDEFNKLFDSLFKDASAYIELIKIISAKKSGVLRAQINEQAKLSTKGGRLSERLEDLAAAGFTETYLPWGKERGEYYKLIDEFCLFYLRWLDKKQPQKYTRNHWATQSNSSAYHSWSGYAFEAICAKHLDQIVEALKIPAGGIISSWRYAPRIKTENGAQIDLLIDRNDKAITLCEIKYNTTAFKIDKAYALNLQNKMEIFRKITGTNKQLFLTMITSGGLKQSIYSEDLIDGVVVLKDLFVDIED